MSRKGTSPQKRQDALIALAMSRALQSIRALSNAVTSQNPVAAAVNGSSSAAGGVNVAAIDFTPKQEGLALVTFSGFLAIAAADTLTITIEEIAGLTSITGGATADAAGLFHYATSGSPLVITAGGSTTNNAQEKNDIATGNIAAVPFSITAIAAVLNRTAFALNLLTTGGQVISGLNLSGAASTI